MIKITKKEQCCGCSACVSICPRHCISFFVDDEGFKYPEIDHDICVNCGMCEKVCPCINGNIEVEPERVMAAFALNEEDRIQSSSGGVFSALAKSFLKNGGVVFGASYDNKWDVCHTSIDKEEALKKLRGSKYVQSDINDIYIRVRECLNSEISVLFSGTPCQINGLRNFLRKDYDNLLCVGIVCHGVASPKVWNEYKKHSIGDKYHNIENINFRDKRKGWKEYGLCFKYLDKTEFYENKSDNLYLKGYLTNTFLRPSCYNCPSKGGRSLSDITLGDYWGVRRFHPEIDYQKGVSLVLIYSSKGNHALQNLEIAHTASSYESALSVNPMIVNSIQAPSDRNLFWLDFQNNGMEALKNTLRNRKPSIIKRIKRVLKDIKRIVNIK